MIRGFVCFACLFFLGLGNAKADFVASALVADSNGLGNGLTPATPQYARLLAGQTRTTPVVANANTAAISAFDFAATPAVNFVRVAFDVFTLHQPFSLTVPLSSNSNTFGGGDVSNFYEFQVTMNNKLGTNPLATFGYNPGDVGKTIGPFLVKIMNNADVTFVNPPLPTTSTSATNGTVNHPYGVYGAGIAAQQLIFGGHSGGGGETPFNSSTTLNFVVSLPSTAFSTNPNFTLQFTANPEPGSLALAGLLGISGVLGLRRRRTQVSTAEVPTETV